MLAVTILWAFVQIAEEVQAQATDALEHGTSDFTSTSELVLNLANSVTSFERSVRLYAILDRAETEELRDLMRDSQDIEVDSEKHETQLAIASRFAAINPQEALETALEVPSNERLPLLEGVFTEWSESDLASATKAAAVLDRDSRLTALKAIVAIRDDLKFDELRLIASELGHPGYVNEMERDFLAANLAEDPIEAWLRMMHDGLEDASQLDTLVQVAEAAVERDGFDALFHLHAPFSKVLFDEEYLVLDKAVEALVRDDPQNTWEYIQKGSSSEQGQSDDSTFPLDSGSPTPRDRAYMTNVVQELLLKSWAAWDPAFVLERIEQIPNQLQALACERALEALVATEPKRVVELIQSLKHLGANRERSVWRIVRRWSETSPSAALGWVQSEHGIGDEQRQDLLTYVLSSLALDNPELALEVAVLQPNFAQLEQRMMYHIAQRDVEAAIEMLPMISEEGQYYANSWVAEQLIVNGEVDRAVALRRQYEEDSGDPVNWFMFFLNWARENPVQLFERLDDLPPKLRFEGAHALDYYYLPELTQEQKDTVQAIYEAGQD